KLAQILPEFDNAQIHTSWNAASRKALGDR
ncbi:MAG: hypothetical protein XD69_1417, partial [Clostridia bacterium 62_21]